MSLDLFSMNGKIIEEWLNKHTDITSEEKNVFINIKKDIGTNMSTHLELSAVCGRSNTYYTSEQYVFAGNTTLTSDWDFPVTVGENEIFVMGDNRNNSADSRTSEIGMIDERCVVGKAYVRIFPIQNFEVFQNPRKN